MQDRDSLHSVVTCPERRKHVSVDAGQSGIKSLLFVKILGSGSTSLLRRCITPHASPESIAPLEST